MCLCILQTVSTIKRVRHFNAIFMYILDLYDGSRDTIYLGSIIPDSPSLHFAEDGQIRVLLPPGAPATSIDEPGIVDCSGGICDLNEILRAPYGNYWFQEEY